MKIAPSTVYNNDVWVLFVCLLDIHVEKRSLLQRAVCISTSSS